MKTIITALSIALLLPIAGYAQSDNSKADCQQSLSYQLELLREQRHLECIAEQQRQELNQAIPGVLNISREARDSYLYQTAKQEWQRQQEAQRDITNKTVPRLQIR